MLWIHLLPHYNTPPASFHFTLIDFQVVDFETVDEYIGWAFGRQAAAAAATAAVSAAVSVFLVLCIVVIVCIQ